MPVPVPGPVPCRPRRLRRQSSSASNSPGWWGGCRPRTPDPGPVRSAGPSCHPADRPAPRCRQAGTTGSTTDALAGEGRPLPLVVGHLRAVEQAQVRLVCEGSSAPRLRPGLRKTGRPNPPPANGREKFGPSMAARGSIGPQAGRCTSPRTGRACARLTTSACPRAVPLPAAGPYTTASDRAAS